MAAKGRMAAPTTPRSPMPLRCPQSQGGVLEYAERHIGSILGLKFEKYEQVQPSIVSEPDLPEHVAKALLQVLSHELGGHSLQR